MNTVELKSNFHRLIDTIDNENILSKFLSIMERVSMKKDGQLWERLNKAEKQELLLIDTEADNDDNLIPHSKIQEKHKKWL